MNLKLVDYKILRAGERMPFPNALYLYEYVFSGNGIFVLAQREHLRVLAPIVEFPERIVGLSSVTGSFEISTTVHAGWLRGALKESIDTMPDEKLFYGLFGPGDWRLFVPRQIATPSSVFPADPYSSWATDALIELHSHGEMEPFFSLDDNNDEIGFRIYSVIGSLPEAPKILTRVGIYGYYWIIPSHWVYDLPLEIEDEYYVRSTVDV